MEPNWIVKALNVLKNGGLKLPRFEKEWVYLYQVVDSRGNTLDFFFSPTRDAKAVKQFLLKTLATFHSSEPRVINVDKNAAYPPAFAELLFLATQPFLTPLTCITKREKSEHMYVRSSFSRS